MIDQQQFRDLVAGVCSPATVVTTTVDGMLSRIQAAGKETRPCPL